MSYKKLKELLIEKLQIEAEIRKLRIINVRSYVVLLERSGMTTDALRTDYLKMELGFYKAQFQRIG